MMASTPNASSTSLNSSRQAPFEPHPDIQTPLRESQRVPDNGQSSHLQWQQSNFGSQASSRRPSESSMDSELHPHNLDSQPHEYMRHGMNRQQPEPSARYGPPPQPTMATSGQPRSVFDEISMPTVESILASQYRTTPTGANSQYQGDNAGSRLSSYSFVNAQPMTTNQTTRNSFQPSFADYNHGHQQITNAGSFGVGSGGSILNSVAASPSLVSALHALQKRCRQLEEDNQVLRENLAKESRAHADSRGTCFIIKCGAGQTTFGLPTIL